MTVASSARRCAVLGHPVAHSLSPLLHRTAYAELGLDWTYEAYDVTAHELADFVAALDDEWRGLSLTMPLKRAVLPLLDELDDVARAVGAANTVLLGSGRRLGCNTDAPGLVAAVRAAGDVPRGSATVLGGGATAASALAALAALGVRSAVLRVRDRGRAEPTANVGAELGVDVDQAGLHDPWPPEPGLLVSTVPSAVAAALVPDSILRGMVVDVGYDPWPSPLLVRVERLGGRTVSGLDLLVHQAVAQVRLMTGRPVDETALAGLMLVAAHEAVDHRRPSRQPPV